MESEIRSLKEGYTVGGLKVSPGLVLAPMSGVTCKPFRQLIKELNGENVGMLVTEFISVEALTRNVPRALAQMNFSEMERPFAIQIFGYDINRMRDAAIMAQDKGADLVDINSGCPAPKVVRKGGGCELMRQPEHLKMVVREMRKVVKTPLTLKMRSGWDSSSLNALEIAKICEGEGIDGLAIHGRTRVQLYRGESDWDCIHRVAEQVSIPVVGSGDVVDLQSAVQCFKPRYSKGIAGIMIGRGSLSNPLVFTEIVTGKKVNLKESPAILVTMLKRYLELLREEFPDKLIPGRIKQLASQACRGHEIRKELILAPDTNCIEELLKRWEGLVHEQREVLTSSEYR